MSDQQPYDRPPQNLDNDAQNWIEPGQKNAQSVYILYLVSMATADPLTWLV